MRENKRDCVINTKKLGGESHKSVPVSTMSVLLLEDGS